MRTESRELLAVGIFGSKSRIGDRIEVLLRRRRTFSSRVSVAGVIASTVVLAGLMLGASFAPRWIAFAQQAVRPSFEVASIKPIPDPATWTQQFRAGKAHIGMKVDGRIVDIGASSIAELICLAYAAPSYRLSGPSWMTAFRFNVLATIPDGASKEQVPEMLQALLAERFKLTVHRENQDRSVYALVIGKNGSKLKESPPDAQPSEGPLGFTRVVPGDGIMHLESTKMPLGQFTDQLSLYLDRPVIDMTDLRGTWQLAVDIPKDALLNATVAAGGPRPQMPADYFSEPADGPAIFESVQKLGLKLEPRKAPIEVIVVDRLEKTPTEN